MKFIITEKQGYKYSQKSGDRNNIHINNLTGYNSFFGEKIIHGTFVLQKLLNLIKIKKKIDYSNKYFIEINFWKHFSYNKIIKYNSNTNKISQSKINRAELYIKKNNYIENLKIKKPNYSAYFKNKNFENFEVLIHLLDLLSKYVGMIYPGKNSIIHNIKINFNKNYRFNNKKIYIYSKKISKKFPIIKNKLIFKQFLISFTSSERPCLKLKKQKIKKNLLKEVKKVDEPVLIIGSSSGIGKEVLSLYENNKKIQIFGTFNHNKFINKNPNIKIFKLNLNKNIMLLKKKLKKFNNFRIYYFATTKIELNTTSKNKISEYEKFYIKYPIKILKMFKYKKIKFFYPSTVYIDENNSYYSKIKKKAEKILIKYSNNNTFINILRLDEINTRQNLSIIKRKLPNFLSILANNKVYKSKVFFY